MRAKPIHRRGIPAEIYEDDNLKSDSLDTLYAHNWEVPKVDSLKVDSVKMDSLVNKKPITPKDTNSTSKTYKPKRHFVGPPVDTIIVFKPKKDEKIKPIKVEPKPLQTTKTKTHVVAAKETLYSLSKKYHTTVEKLCKANKLTKNSVLSIGQILIIPKE
jgi:LysM repeat protein